MLLPETLSPQAVVPDVVPNEATNVVPGATVAGVIRGSLAMLAISAFSIPLLGPFIVAGPILASFGKFELGAVGGLIGALVGMGIPAPDATHYEGRVKEGGVLLTVHSDTADDAVKAMDLLKATGAEHVSSPVTTAAGATISN